MAAGRSGWRCVLCRHATDHLHAATDKGLGMRPAELSPFERFLHLFAPVRAGEGRSVRLMLTQVFLLLLAYYLIRPVREALILAEGSPEVRSYAVGAVALSIMFLIPLYTLLFDHLDGRGAKAAVLRWVMLFFISHLLLFCALGALGVPVAVPFFIWVGVFSVMQLAQFWAFAADLFNVKTGQRLFAVIAVGAALGAWTGSRLSGWLFPLVGPYRVMLLSALLLGVVTWLSTRVEGSIPAASRAAGDTPDAARQRGSLGELLGGFAVVLRSRYLVLVAAFVALVNWINSTGGYILASFVDAHATRLAGVVAATKGDAIAAFYGDYFAWIAVLQLLLQMFVVSRLLRWWGVRGTLLVLPAVMALNYGLIALVPAFSLVRLMMIAENSSNYSIHNTACHSLFLPLTRQQKYIGKTTVDTFFWRFGDLLHAFMIFVANHWLGLTLAAIMLVNLALALSAFALALAIGQRHRTELREHLVGMPPAHHPWLDDVFVPAGVTRVLELPEHTFIDPDPGGALTYLVRSADGNPLPPWVRFRADDRSFVLSPPDGSNGCVAVELVATDFDGLQVTARFRVRHGPPAPVSATSSTHAPGAPAHRPGVDAGTGPAAPGSPR